VLATLWRYLFLGLAALKTRLQVHSCA